MLHSNLLLMVLLNILLHRVTCGSTVAWLVPQGGGQVAPPAGALIFTSMESFLHESNLAVYDEIVLTSDYSMSSAAWGQRQITLQRNLTMRSASGYVFMLEFDFIQGGVVVPRGVTVTLRDMALSKVRKTTGWVLPFFAGDGGVMWLENVVRVRLVCLPLAATAITNLQQTLRPAGFPGTQNVSLIDYYFRGTVHEGSVHDTDLVMFLGPGDVDDSELYSGYTMVQYNVTRVCVNYTPPDCQEQPDACLLHAVEGLLSSMAGGSSQQQRKRTVEIVVPVLVAVVVALAAVGVIVLRRHLRKQQGLTHKQVEQPWQQQLQLDRMEQQQLALSCQQPGQQQGKEQGKGLATVQIGSNGCGNSLDANFTGPAGAWRASIRSGAVGTIQDMATGMDAAGTGGSSGASSRAMSRWRLMACHTSPDFRDATPKDKITLGVLLGVGSFGRVYKGVWRGMDVAVKVLHHDSTTAAAVANEVDLIMSFRHPNITTAYHFVTWNYESNCEDADVHKKQAAGTAADAEADAPLAAAAAEAVVSNCSQSGSMRHLAGHRVLADSGNMVALAPAAAAAAADLHVGQVQFACGFAAARTEGTGGPEPMLGEISFAVAPLAGVANGVLGSAKAAAAAPGINGAVHDYDLSSRSCSPGSLYHSSTSNAGGPLVPPDEPEPGGPSSAAVPGTAISVACFPASQAAVEAAAAEAAGASAGAGKVESTVVAAAGLAPGASSRRHSAGQTTPGGAAAAAARTAAESLRRLSDSQAVVDNAQLFPVLNQRPSDPQQLVLPLHSLVPGEPSQDLLHQQQQQQQQNHIPVTPKRSAPTLQQQQQPQSLAETPTPQQQQFLPITTNELQRHLQELQQPQQPDLGHARQQQQQQQQLGGAARPGQHSSTSGGSTSRDRSGKGQREAQTWLLMEFCDGGTLLDLLQEGRLLNKTTGQVKMAHMLTLLCDVAAGMAYLHSRNVLHGDLKPGNVLLKQQQGAPFGHTCKVTDFGMSRSLNVGQSHRSTRTMGTVNHTSPELMRLGRLSPAGDCYAFGILMHELYTGQVAWSGLHYGEVFERVALLQERPPIPPDMPRDYAQLMTAAWAADPFARPSFEAVQQQLQAMLGSIMQDQAEANERFVCNL